MKKIDLTQLALLVLLGVISFWGVRQCSTRNMYEKALDEVVLEKESLRKEAALNKSYIDSLKSINESLAEERAVLKRENKRILASYRLEKAKVEQYTSDTLYMLLKGSHDLTGSLYDIDSTLLLQAELTKLERKECIELSMNLKSEVDFLNNAVFEMSDWNNKIAEDLDECEFERVSLEGDLDREKLEGKELKKKVWVNRGVAGGLGLVLLLILL